MTIGSPARKDPSVRFAVIVLAALVVASLALRLWLLHTAASNAGFSPVDADGYMRNGRLLARGGDGWRWTLDAVHYDWNRRTYLLPPLYPVFLSAFALFSDSYPYSALVGQAALNALSVLPVFVIAATLHSRRAGLIAAAVYAFWLPNVWTFALFIQEQLYIPLLLAAFALLLRAAATNGSPAAFAAAGAAFGCAALTRSMPMYYLALVAIGYAATMRLERTALRTAAALLLGFLLVTGPYSVWLSQQTGGFVFIENHAGISIHRYGVTPAPGVPGTGQILGQLFEAFRRDPAAFAGTGATYARALFHVHGDRWLQSYQAATAEDAAVAKFIAHAAIDLPFTASVVLAPLGAVLARRSREAALLVAWVVLVVMLSTLSTYGGVRYRSPFEPHLIALAAVVLSGGWRRPSRTALLAAGVAAVALATMLAVQFPRVARGRANYGLSGWSESGGLRRASAHGRFGINVLRVEGVLQFKLLALEQVSPEQPSRVSIHVDGQRVDDRLLSTADPQHVRFIKPGTALSYVEVNAVGASGEPARVGIEVAR